MDLVASDVSVAVAAVDATPNLETLVWDTAWANASERRLVHHATKAYLSDLVATLQPITVYVRASKGKATKMVGDETGNHFMSDSLVDLHLDEWKKI